MKKHPTNLMVYKKNQNNKKNVSSFGKAFAFPHFETRRCLPTRLLKAHQDAAGPPAAVTPQDLQTNQSKHIARRTGMKNPGPPFHL
jgi:hypothetical protein